jgi:hypothetical protein
MLKSLLITENQIGVEIPISAESNAITPRNDFSQALLPNSSTIHAQKFSHSPFHCLILSALTPIPSCPSLVFSTHSSLPSSSKADHLTLFCASDPYFNQHYHHTHTLKTKLTNPSNPKFSHPCSACQKSCVIPLVPCPINAGSSFDSAAGTPLASSAGRGWLIILAVYRSTSLEMGQLSTKMLFSFTESIRVGCL